MEILFVDDSSAILEQGEIFLEREDSRFNVTTVNSAKKALNLLEEQYFDAIVSDYKMPDMDGLDFLKVVREERNSDLPFVIFTGKGREEVAMEALNLGADRYLRKGRDPESQYGLLANAIAQEIEYRRVGKEKDRKGTEWKVTADSLPGIAALISPNLEIVRINGTGSDLIDMEPEELKGKKCYEVVHNQDKPIPECPCLEASETKSKTIGEFEKNGKHWFTTASPILDDNGEIEAFAHYIQDITESWRAKENLKKRDRQLKAVLNDPQTFIGILDLDGNVLEANRASPEFIDTPPSGVEGKKFWNTPWWTHSEELQDRLRDAVNRAANGNYERFEAWHEGKDGEVITVDFSLRPIRNEEGEITSLIAEGIDITERKRTEERLKEVEERYQSLFERSMEAIFVHDFEGNFIDANPRALDMLGYSESDMKPLSFEDIVAEEYLPKAERNTERILEKGRDEEAKEFKLERKDGNQIWVETRATTLHRNGEPYAVMGIARDITERKQMEKELKREKDRYKELVEGANDLVATTDLEGNVKGINKKCLEFFGYTEDEIVGENIIKLAHPDDRDNWLEIYNEVRENEEATRILRGIDKEGNTIWLKTGGKVIEEDDEIVELQYNSQDITVQKEREERENFLHSLLRHDQKNMIQNARGYHKILESKDLSDEQKEILEKANGECKNGVKLIERVRTLRRLDEEVEKEKLPVAPIIRNAINDVETEASENGVEIIFDESNPVVIGGRLLQEIFLNLFRNSIKHSGCEKIRVSISEEEEEVLISVSDDGCGLSNEMKERIFEKGFKKGSEAGTGLGTYLVKEIAENYGGSVEVEDSEEGGTRFIVRLEKARVS